MSAVEISKKHKWLLLIALLACALIVGIALPWQARWRFLAYFPLALLIGHGILLALSLYDPKYWKHFKAYWAVPIAVQIIYACVGIAAFFKHPPLHGGPLMVLFLLFIPFTPTLPFSGMFSIEQKIEQEEIRLYAQALEAGDTDDYQFLYADRPLAPVEEKFLLRKIYFQPNTLSAEIINQLVLRYTAKYYSPNSGELKGLLLHPATSPENLLIFAQAHPDNEDTKFVAQNAKAPIEAIHICATSQNIHVQIAAIQSNRLSREDCEAILWDMILNEKHGWEVQVLRTPFATASMLENIIDLKTLRGGAIVRNPAVSESQLARLSQHERPGTRKAVAEHPRAPIATLQELTTDPEPAVADAAKKALQVRLSKG